MAAPLLTPAQFAKTPAAKKPGASYRGYVTYVNKKRASRAAARVANPFAAFLTDYRASMLTPAQQQAQAQKNVNQQISLQIAGAKAAQAAAAAQIANQSKRAQGYALALGQLTDPTAQQVQQQYAGAADRLRAYGTGLTGEAAAIQQRSAEDAAARVAQLAGVGQATGLDVGALRNTNQILGTVIPGQTLEAQAVNAVQEARNQAAMRAQGIENIAQGFLGKGADLATELAAKKAEIQATRPALIAQALESARGGQRQDMATLISALALQNQTANTASQITARGVTAASGAQTAATGRGRITGINPATGALLPGFYYPNAQAKKDKLPQRVPGTHHVDPKNPYRLVPNKPPGGGGAATAKNVQAMIDKAGKLVTGAVTQPPYVKAQTAIEKDLGRPLVPVLTWAGAKQRLMNAYVPKQFRANPRVVAWIEDALERVGYKRPTAGGTKTTPLPGNNLSNVTGGFVPK